eukprot:1559017-Pleurochrysis_carterae.AAC.1
MLQGITTTAIINCAQRVTAEPESIDASQHGAAAKRKEQQADRATAHRESIKESKFVKIHNTAKCARECEYMRASACLRVYARECMCASACVRVHARKCMAGKEGSKEGEGTMKRQLALTEEQNSAGKEHRTFVVAKEEKKLTKMAVTAI